MAESKIYSIWQKKKKHMNKQTNTYNDKIICNKFTVPIKSLMPHLYDRRASELQLNEKGPIAISISYSFSVSFIFLIELSNISYL